jgi:hypothetical protein
MRMTTRECTTRLACRQDTIAATLRRTTLRQTSSSAINTATSRPLCQRSDVININNNNNSNNKRTSLDIAMAIWKRLRRLVLPAIERLVLLTINTAILRWLRWLLVIHLAVDWFLFLVLFVQQTKQEHARQYLWLSLL